jgi:hypothetical protein
MDSKMVVLFDTGAIYNSGKLVARPGFSTKASWLVMGECEIYDSSELPALVLAASIAAKGDGLPGTMRSLINKCLRLKLAAK